MIDGVEFFCPVAYGEWFGVTTFVWMEKRQQAAYYIRRVFGHEPTADQQQLITKLGEFVASEVSNALFLLRGYAGTGKTTVVSALVHALPLMNQRTVLMAPTGRAAKVISQYAQQPAYTIHKKIYLSFSEPGGGVKTILTENRHTNTLFIVDEASMIQDQSGMGEHVFGQRNLLDDLVHYVYQGDGCRLLLLGDSAQLPPVGSVLSPALDSDYLRAAYSFDIMTHELHEVVRQAHDSGILLNATRIRTLIAREAWDEPFFDVKGMPDVIRITGADLEEALNETFSYHGADGAVVITRSNKRANIFNNEIRNRILYREEELSAGDMLMVVRNNYYWLEDKSKGDFIANGDVVEVLRIRNREELYGFHFVDALVRMPDYPGAPELEVKLMLDTLHSETASLTSEEYNRLMRGISEDFPEITSRRKMLAEIRKTPHYHALQVKFAYALTCHKTQGGQWEAVFVDQGYLTDEMVNTEYLRWLYTAVTRATEKLYLVNFNEKFYLEP